MKSRDYKQDIYDVILNAEEELSISDINDILQQTVGYHLDSFSVLGYLQQLQKESLVEFCNGGYVRLEPETKNEEITL